MADTNKANCQVIFYYVDIHKCLQLHLYDDVTRIVMGYVVPGDYNQTKVQCGKPTKSKSPAPCRQRVAVIQFRMETCSKHFDKVYKSLNP